MSELAKEIHARLRDEYHCGYKHGQEARSAMPYLVGFGTGAATACLLTWLLCVAQ